MRSLAILLVISASCSDDRLAQVPEEEPRGCTEPERPFARAFHNMCATPPGEPEVGALDILFVIDTTGSMSPVIRKLQENLHQLVTRVREGVPDSYFGVAHFEDFPQEDWGSRSDSPYELFAELTDDMDAVGAALDALTNDAGQAIGHGNDHPEASIEALYQAATGEGFDLTGDGAYDNTLNGDVPPQPAGWREDARKIIVHVTDAEFRDPDDDDPAPDGAHGEADVIAALSERGIHVVGIAAITPQCDYCNDLDPASQPGCFAFCELTIAAWGDPYDEMVPICVASGGVSLEGYDGDGDGLTDGEDDIPPGGPLVWRTDLAGNPIGAAGGDIGSVIAVAVETITRQHSITAEVGGEDSDTIRRLDLDPIRHDAIPAGTEVCFDAVLHGAVPGCDEPRELSLELNVLADTSVIATFDLSFTP